MANTLETLLSLDISDATDFPDAAAAPGLRQFDDALRCSICRDLYDAPVTLQCGHCFCSACIRSALPEHATCPSCRKPASEVHIRKDVAMESAVNAWRVARPLVLRLAREEEERTKWPPSQRTNRAGQKRKRRPSRDSTLSEEDDDEVQLVPATSSPVPSGSSTPDIRHLPDTVLCPICEKAVPSQKINIHIDSGCKRHLQPSSAGNSTTSSAPPSSATESKSKHKHKQKQEWNKLFGSGTVSGYPPRSKDKDRGKGKTRASPDNLDEAGEPEPLPKVAYDIHPAKRIVELLSEFDLPTHGEKASLVRRHRRWIVLYNANLDRAPATRRTLDQLRLELRRVEDAEARTRKETVEDPVAYQKANKATFAKLTEAARPKKTTGAEADLSADGEALTPDPVESARISSPEVTGHAAPEVEVIEVDES